jgi:hypothetical protein
MHSGGGSLRAPDRSQRHDAPVEGRHVHVHASGRASALFLVHPESMDPCLRAPVGGNQLVRHKVRDEGPQARLQMRKQDDSADHLQDREHGIRELKLGHQDVLDDALQHARRLEHARKLEHTEQLDYLHRGRGLAGEALRDGRARIHDAPGDRAADHRALGEDEAGGVEGEDGHEVNYEETGRIAHGDGLARVDPNTGRLLIGEVEDDAAVSAS